MKYLMRNSQIPMKLIPSYVIKTQRNYNSNDFLSTKISVTYKRKTCRLDLRDGVC
jgi:hypothetical protein